MRFNDPNLRHALTAWRAIPNHWERAKADNAWFEERVSGPRLAEFEAEVAAIEAPRDLADKQIWYFKNFVRHGDPWPPTFSEELEPARLGPHPLEPFQPILRLEDLRTPLRDQGLDFSALHEAWRTRQSEVVDQFLREWNDTRDNRPAFAAWKDQLLDELTAADWADRLRDRMGLGHYDPADAPIPVVLMEYTAGDVMNEAAALGLSQGFTAPTVLDGGPWPYFFPSPAGLPYGRAMPLSPMDTEKQFLAEMLHIRLIYRAEHIAAFGMIRRRLPDIDMKASRNDHLANLQLAADRFDFGEEIP